MIEEVKKLCRAYGITPERSKGQHFLIDETVIDTITAAADLDRRDTVLEVGPGLGILTDALVQKAGQVISVELDQKLYALLKARFITASNLQLVNADILRFNSTPSASSPRSDSSETRRAKRDEPLPAGYKIVANIPYNITSRFLKTYLTTAVKPSTMTLLIQTEVAQRICAQPGQLSLLGISIQLYGQPMIIGTVNRDRFWPEPAVDSAILVIRGIKSASDIASELSPVTEKQFWRLVRVGFSAKRKKLANNLISGLKIPAEAVKNALAATGLEPNIRAQHLSVDAWTKLAKNLILYLN